MTLIEQFDAAVARWPDLVAVVDPDGTPLTYRELDHQAACLAGCLSAHGVVPGDRVAVFLPKSSSAVVSLIGVMKAGAAYVPADYAAPLDRNRSIATNAAVTGAIVDSRNLAVFEDGERPAVVVVVGEWPGDAASPTTLSWADAIAVGPMAAHPEVTASDVAYILFTSGSTGVPKGVTLSHENATSFVDWCSEVFEPTPADRFSSHAPFHFDLSVLDLYVAFKHGAAVHLVSEELGKSPKELARFIADRAITIWYSTPSILALLAEFGDLDARRVPSLRIVLFAGEVFPIKHLRRVVACWPAPAYFNLYGPTETNVCTFARIPVPIPEDRENPFPIGWPCSHCRALVVDADGRVVDDGAEGLLYIAGPAVFRGYWGRPDLDSGVFLERTDGHWYNTGDVVRLDASEGYIYLGRRDRMVKRRGYRVELGEIERGLYRHAGIVEAAVVAVASDSGVRIVAFIAPGEGQKPSIIELKRFCAEHLPSYMSPDVFSVVAALPRTSTNKVDYQSLQRSAAAPAGHGR